MCSSRFEILNALFEENFSEYFEFNIIGVGKAEYSTSNSNFTNGTNLPFVVDSSTWINWNAQQRDLILLDKNGNFFCNINLTSGFNEQDILDKINHLYWNTTANIDIELDFSNSDNVFIPGSNHTLNISVINNSPFDAHYAGYLLSSNSPNIEFSNSSNWFYVVFENTIGVANTNIIIGNNVSVGDEIIINAEPNHINDCDDCEDCDIDCNECYAGGNTEISFSISPGQLMGDVNTDGLLNVLDVVVIVNLVLNEESYNELADMNNDDDINVQDIIVLINIILN